MCLGCVARGAEAAAPSAPSPSAPPPLAPTTIELTRSPQVPHSPVPLSGTCEGMDAGLVTVAKKLAAQVEATGRLSSADELTFELRQAGLPYVWPTVFTATGSASDPSALREKLLAWLGGQSAQGAQRCGVAIRRLLNNTTDLLLVIVVDALADVTSMPRWVHANTSLAFNFQLRSPASDVSLLALGPTGLPREVLTHFDPSTGVGRATLTLPTSGRFLVQLLATLESGPRPVAEAEVWVDVPIPTSFESTEVPGEADVGEAATTESDLWRMLNAARQSEGLNALALDAPLSDLARAHALRMSERQQTSHDAGDGDPEQRLKHYRLPGGVTNGPIGENVARATSLRGAHRVLWLSPAHRRTLLYKDFTHVGVGTATGPGGEVWACELFVGPGNLAAPATE